MRTYLTEKRGITFCQRFLPERRCAVRQRMVLARAILAVILAASLSSFCLAEGRGLLQLKQAEKHIQQADKEYDAALELCKELIKSHPELEAEARLLMSRIYVKKGRWNDAAIEAKKVVKKSPESEEALRALKLIYQAHISAGHPQGAEAWILPLVEGVFIPAGRGDEALERLANIYLDMRAYDKVLVTADRLIKEYPQSPQLNKVVSYIFAVYKRRAGDQAGLARMQEFIGLHRGSYLASCAQYQVGGFYRREKDRARAIEEFEELVRAYPDSPLCSKVLRDVGDLYYREKDLDRAIAATRKGLEQFKSTPKEKAAALRQLAVLYVYNKEYDKAIERYQAILGIEGQAEHWYPFAESFIAYCYTKQGKYRRAIKLYRKIIAKYPSIGSFAAGSQYNIGKVYFTQGKYAKAIEAFQKVVDIYPDNPWAPIAEKKIAFVKRRFGGPAR